MPTRSQAIRARQQRDAHPPRPKRPARPRRDVPIDTAKPGVSATDRKAGYGSTASRNRSNRSEKKGGASLENSATGTPSRKSTRASKGGVERTSNLKLRATRKASAPETRAEKAKAKKA